MTMPYALMISIEFLFRVQCDNGKFNTINIILTCRKLPQSGMEVWKGISICFWFVCSYPLLTNYNYYNLVQNKKQKKIKGHVPKQELNFNINYFRIV